MEKEIKEIKENFEKNFLYFIYEKIQETTFDGCSREAVNILLEEMEGKREQIEKEAKTISEIIFVRERK